MEKVIKKKELIDLLATKTGYYKKSMKDVVEALSEIVLESLQNADFDQDSELHIAPGVVICGKRKPEQESVNPQDNSPIITPEKVVPYAIFKRSVRDKLRSELKRKRRK